MEEKNNMNKKIGALIIGIAVLVVSITGSTFAYFALTTGNQGTNAINGTTATAELALRITPQSSGGSSSGSSLSGKVVPQLDAAIGTAIGNNYKCIDANGNIVCLVYLIEIENRSSAGARVNGTITFTSYSTTNLRWRRLQSATAVSGTTTGSYNANGVTVSVNTETDLISGSACTPASSSAGCTRVELQKTDGANWSGSDYTSYYIVVWLHETSADQTTADAGKTFTASIKFEGESGTGITSTITA